MQNLAKHVSRTKTAQTSKAKKDQVKNSAGGFVFELTPFDQLDRFLILGTSGGTYYSSEKKLTKDNADAIEKCLAQDYKRAIDRIVEISTAGRAPKVEPAIFALALAAANDNEDCRRYALSKFSQVCRIGTHVFIFMNYIKELRGTGSLLRKSLADWYLSKDPVSLAYQVTKYAQREGWSHRDVLRVAHPRTDDAEKNKVFKFVTQGSLPRVTKKIEESSEYLRLASKAREVASAREAIELMKRASDFGLPALPHEVFSTEIKNDPKFQEALFENGMPLGALIRNVANFSKSGLLVDQNFDFKNAVAARLSNPGELQKARIHPLNYYVAYRTYSSGQGLRGSGSWKVSGDIVDAMEEGFYNSFDYVEPTNKKILLAIDISASMTWANCSGLPITPREASTIMAMSFFRNEKNSLIKAFSTGQRIASGRFGRRGWDLADIAITRKSTLKSVDTAINRMSAGGTDCALPALWATESDVDLDAIVIFTDNETWAGSMHPFQALKAYRNKVGHPVRQVVCGMTSTGFTIAEPNDPHSLDVVGADSALPQVVSWFIQG